eukprot:gene9838-11551_t
MCKASFATILKVLNDKSEHFTSPLSSTASNSKEEGILLPLVQLEFLVSVPVGKGLVSCLQQVLATTGLIGDTISSALKRSSVSEVVVPRCSQLWQLWVHIAAELLVPQDLPTGLILASGGGVPATVIDGAGGGEVAKNAFMSLLAPKNGVGVLTAPLQPILRRSRSEAARCYLTLAQCLVLAQDWHQPASVLKLLLRCLYHLLFTDIATTSNTATVNTSSKSNIPSTGVSEEVIKRERDNLLALKTAGEAVQVLCANIPRKHLRAVPLISISLGRLPSAACSSTHSSPRARKATATANTGCAITAVATAPAPAPITPRKGAQQSVCEAPTNASTSLSSERASLDIIIRKLLDTTELNTVCNGSSGLGDITVTTDQYSVLILLVVALSRVQHVCSGAVALSSMLSSLGPLKHDNSVNLENTGATSSSAPSNMHIVATGNAAQRKSHHHLLSKGLFASPSKITIKPIGTTNTTNAVSTSNNNKNNNATSGPSEEPLACTDILNHMQHLHTAMTSLATTDSIHASLASKHVVVYKKLVKSLDFTSQLYNACTKLTTSWQLCTLALAQVLFDSALTEGTHHREGEEITLSAPRYQSTQLDSFSLLFSGPTQSSQIYLHHQHHHLQNITINHNKRSPHKFSNTSPSQSSHVKTSLPSSYPNLDSPLNAAGASPMMQVVLCSAHPPAVQAAVDLCSVFVKVWVDVWLSTSLGRQQHKQRAVFVESFWWFLHRTTAFGVDVNDDDAEVLFSAVLSRCPELSVLHCPTNMAGIAMLVSVCHAHLCDTLTPPPAPARSHAQQPPRSQSHSASLDILLRALHQSMNSMTESGVLPGLFAWVPPLLARLCPSDADSSFSSNMQGSSITSTNKERKGDGVITVAQNHSHKASEHSVRFLCSFLRHALQQLSSMSVPSASEQHSPSLMHNMISGLRCLLVFPLVLCVTGMRGVHHLFEDKMSVLPHDSTATTPVSPAQQVINNWKSILSLWLELREFTVAHFGEEEKDLAASEEEVDPSLAWIEALLGQNAAKVANVSFRLHPTISAQDELSRTEMVCSADESVHKDLQTSLLLVQAALEVSVQHRCKYPRSPLTTGLAVSAASILVSLCASLDVNSVGEMKEYSAVSLKAVDGLINKILPLFPTLDAHLAELGAGKIRFCIQSLADPSHRDAQLMEVVFTSLFQCIASIHHSPQTAMSSRYVKQWTLAVLSSLCAHQNALTNRSQSGFGFRSAASTLAVGEPHRAVVRAFVSLLTTTNNGDRLVHGVDAEMKEFIMTAWRELGGADNEILSVFNQVGDINAGDDSTKSVTSEALASSSVEQQTGSFAALPVAPGSTVGVKRSFVPALASPVPVLAGAHNESFSSPPPKVPKVAPSNAHITPVAPITYVKVALQPSDLASLAQKTSNTRQGFVPATYTGADRTNLNEQSQQSQVGTSSQLISQLASQAMPPPLSPPLRVSAQARSPLTGSEPQVFPIAQSALVSGSHPLPSVATENHTTVAPVYMHASQHSDSTTYVSPSPALGNNPASVQRRQSMMGLSAPRTPASLPLLDDMQCESVPAGTEPTVIAQDSHVNSSSSGSSSNSSSSLSVQIHAAGESSGAMDVAQSELDHNNHTIAPESHHSEGETHNSDRNHTVLAVSAELHHTIQQLSAQNIISTGGLPVPQQENRAGLLSAAIRQSHKLTGILLDLLSENPPTEDR